MNEWIDIADRHPEKSGKYKVLCDDLNAPDGEGIWYEENVEVLADYIATFNIWEWTEGSTTFYITDYVVKWREETESERMIAVAENLKELEDNAYNWSINDEVLGMNCSDFEKLMSDASKIIKSFLKEEKE